MTNAIKSVLSNTALRCDAYNSLGEKEFITLFRLSKLHDIANVVGEALLTNGVQMPDKVKFEFIKQQTLAVSRYERINYELGELATFFEQNQIPFMPLKGSVIREYYKRPDLRTSCDIDILIKKSDVDRAVKLLEEQKDYKKEAVNIHDVSLFAPSGVHLELHYKLFEDDKNADKILGKCWETGLPYGDGQYGKKMNAEYNLCYIILHAAKHFIRGGCGVRSVMDVFVLVRKGDYNEEKLTELLQKTDYLKFYHQIKKLAFQWFGDQEMDDVLEKDVLEKMEEYIIQGGVYGSRENMVVSHNKDKSKFATLIAKVFPDYNTLSYVYPIINTCPVLYPFCIVARWFKVFSKKKREDFAKDLEYNDISKEKRQEISKFFDDIGL